MLPESEVNRIVRNRREVERGPKIYYAAGARMEYEPIAYGRQLGKRKSYRSPAIRRDVALPPPRNRPVEW